jgi:peptidyl-prolyl cis-trans isomerase B (cyclophilin B)
VSQHYPEGPATGPIQAPPPPPQYPGQTYGEPYGYAASDNQRQRTNVMAILGLVFAFIFSPLGIVFSAIGLSQIKRRREGGKGLAISGLVL